MLEKLPVAVGNTGAGPGRQVLSCQLVIFFSLFQTVDLDKVKGGISLDQPVIPGAIWLLPISAHLRL